jgi:hypothetical protein
MLRQELLAMPTSEILQTILVLLAFVMRNNYDFKGNTFLKVGLQILVLKVLNCKFKTAEFKNCRKQLSARG